MSQPANQSGRVVDRRFSGTRDGSTLIELLVVITIIAILISILVPAIGRAIEQARIVKCLSNQRFIAQGVQAFALDHFGYGQIAVADGLRHDGRRLGPADVEDTGKRKHFAYEPDLTDPTRQVVSPWPVAYAPYLGAGRVRTDDLLTTLDDGELAGLQARLAQKVSMPLLRCPSKPDAIGKLFLGDIVGYLGYGPNTAVFGASVWRPDIADLTYANSSTRSNLGRVFRPAQVLMFVDAGGGPRARGRAWGSAWVNIGTHGRYLGPWLGNAQRRFGTLPGDRHSRDGALCASFVDGHASFLRPREWVQTTGMSDSWEGKVVTRWSPNPRVSPFNPDAPPRVSRR